MTAVNLEDSLLRSFVAVAETGSFTAAAAQIGRSQSAVSLQIRRLEEMLQCALLTRSRRAVALTEQGEDFLAYTRRILRLHAEAVGAVNPHLGEAVVRLGMPNDYAELVLPEVLRRFDAHYPQIRCTIECDMTWELLRRLEHGQLDIVLGIRHSTQSSGQTLCQEEIVWVAGPDYEAGDGAEAAVPLVLYPETCPYRARGIEALAGSGRDWRIVYTSQSPTGIRIAVEQRGAVTITSRRTVPRHWQILGPEQGFPALPPADLQLYSAASDTTQSVQTLLDMLAAEFA